VEIVEAPDHPWFLGCQFHPEFKSKPLEPHPLFAAFIGAALEHKKQNRGQRPPLRVEARSGFARCASGNCVTHLIIASFENSEPSCSIIASACILGRLSGGEVAFNDSTDGSEASQRA